MVLFDLDHVEFSVKLGVTGLNRADPGRSRAASPSPSSAKGPSGSRPNQLHHRREAGSLASAPRQVCTPRGKGAHDPTAPVAEMVERKVGGRQAEVRAPQALCSSRSRFSRLQMSFPHPLTRDLLPV